MQLEKAGYSECRVSKQPAHMQEAGLGTRGAGLRCAGTAACRQGKQLLLKSFLVVFSVFWFWSLLLQLRCSCCWNVARRSPKCHFCGDFNMARGEGASWHSQRHCEVERKAH